MKIRFQQQNEHSECGLACVAMLIDFFKKDTLIQNLRQKYGVPTGGYNLYQLSTILKDYNIENRVLKVKSFDYIEDLKSIKYPFIAFWNNNHFIIVENFNKDKVTIIDPSIGRRHISLKEFRKNFSYFLLCPIVDKKIKREKKRSLSSVLSLEILVKYKSIFLLVFFISIIMQLFNLLLPYYIKKIIDSKTINTYEIILILCILPILYYTVNFSKYILSTKLQNYVDKELLSRTIWHLLDLPYSFFVNRNKGELIYRINSNTFIKEFLTQQFLTLLIDSIFFTVYLFIMIRLSVQLTLITILIAILIGIFLFIYSRKNDYINQKQIIENTKTQDIINEAINNIYTVKATNSQRLMFERWEEKFNKSIDYDIRKAKYSSIYRNISETINMFYPLIIFGIGSLIVKNNSITVGDIIAFSIIGGYFLNPLLSILNSYNQILMVKIFLNKLADILATDTEDKNIELLPYNSVNNSYSVVLKNVNFKYSYFSDESLKNLNIDIKKGEKIAIVGESGSGKSTLLKLMGRLYLPTSGQIFYNNYNSEKIDISNLRKNMGIVLQENFLFSGTLRDNIRMGKEVNDTEIIKALKMVDMYNFMKNLPIGLDTNISENGQNISGGQRQRIAIARAILSRPKIIFLDEPTSALDNIAEIKILNTLLNFQSTVIIASHRLTEIDKFDRIIVMDNGKILAVGRHDELIKNNFKYKELIQKYNIGEVNNL
ncbi:peptidase domain-containing ABC transporter (plasmid) [Macrococcoides canis]|uniref:peptidase domain-containing ABC transporter n=1 Tax=Macrococcoides canis TaxID=1855823 RepID=UPI001F1CC927|nr:peptidase domain-containing ABC transporter [Macrococcus canis]UJS29011.1 peptidase domain-containing ABC transporter [Macrococcus canis]